MVKQDCLQTPDPSFVCLRLSHIGALPETAAEIIVLFRNGSCQNGDRDVTKTGVFLDLSEGGAPLLHGNFEDDQVRSHRMLIFLATQKAVYQFRPIAHSQKHTVEADVFQDTLHNEMVVQVIVCDEDKAMAVVQVGFDGFPPPMSPKLFSIKKEMQFPIRSKEETGRPKA
jgi:hypothetical protein